MHVTLSITKKSRLLRNLPFEGSIEGEGGKKERSVGQASLSSANLPQKLLGVAGLANGSGRQVDEVVSITVDRIEEFNL